ncbi:MAG: S53 family peptidase [Thermoguttaceae bacterium]
MRLESLEARALLSVSPLLGVAVPLYRAHLAAGSVVPLSTSGPTGLTPAQIRQAYGINQITFNGGTVAGDGTGTTIAIVDAYDDPNIANDLHQFDVRFGLPDPAFSKVNEYGSSALRSLPSANKGWTTEIALDVEWAHAIAPKAAILLVEAASASFTDLFTAITTAAGTTGVDVVSMSWGGGDFSGENYYDGYFTTPANHNGVTFLAASGDAGAPVGYPAISANVVAVGGTTLNLNSSGTYLSESGWSGSGGGISSYESDPSYQRTALTQAGLPTTYRANPDVSYDADPNTGFPVYDSYNNGTSRPWGQWGGTSDAAPQWAGIIAIADQGRALAGLGSLDGATQTLPKLYSLPGTDFHDITTGASTGSPHYSAGPGYDLVTGRGTPYANLIVSDLVGSTASSTPTATQFSVAGPASDTAGTAVSITVTALDSTGTKIVTGYTGTVHFTTSDAAALGLPANYTYTFTAADSGVHTFTNLVTLVTAGPQTITVADISTGTIAGTLSVPVTPNVAAQIAWGQQPSGAAPGGTISPAVTVQVLDAYGNLVTSDKTDSVTIAIGNNPGLSTLNGTPDGTVTATASGGIAAFSNLSINNPGIGYTLKATSGSFAPITSNTFNIQANSVIEDFEGSSTYNVVGGRLTAYISTAAAHDGAYGLVQYNGSDWIYRSDSAAQVKAGETISVWLQLAGSADGRAYFAFGASGSGTLSLVAAPNTGQLILQNNSGWGYTNLAAVNQTWQANHWYRLEVQWGTSGKIVGNLYDSNGTTLLRTVTASTTAITSGGFGFRATGSNKYWDTVTVTLGAGTANHATTASGAGATGSSGAPAPSPTPGDPWGGAAPPVASWGWGAGWGAQFDNPLDRRLVDAFFGFFGT